MIICRFKAKAIFNLPIFFAVSALLLNILYIYHFTPLFPKLPHGAQRFCQTVQLAERMVGRANRIPVSLLELVHDMSPRLLSHVSAIPCSQWDNEDAKKYCNGALPRPQGQPSFAQLLSIPLEPENNVIFAPVVQAGQYSIVSYAGYMPAALLGVALQWPPLVILYGCALCNACLTILLGYYTLRMLPILRWPICYALLLPTMLITRTLFFPDALTVELSFLVVALSLKLAYAPQPLKDGQQFGLVMLAALLGMIKSVYFFVPLIFLLIPDTCFGTQTRKRATAAASVACAMAAGIIWGMHVREIYYPQLPSLWQQLQHIDIYAFFSSIGALLSHWQLLLSKIHDYLIWQAGWPHSNSSILIMLLPLLLPAFISPPEDTAFALGRRHRLISLSIFMLSVITLWGIMFVQVKTIYHYHSYEQIDRNIFGRYFAPLVPLLLLSIYGLLPLKPAAQRWARPAYALLALACLIYLHYNTLQLPYKRSPTLEFAENPA